MFPKRRYNMEPDTDMLLKTDITGSKQVSKKKIVKNQAGITPIFFSEI